LNAKLRHKLLNLFSAAAGFEVLGQLARKTQILFFTHHRHLAEIAEATLGSSVAVVSLMDSQIASAA
jgi:hypothetical protein